MDEQEYQDLLDLRQIFLACKDEEAARRAGILVSVDEFVSTLTDPDKYRLAPTIIVVEATEGFSVYRKCDDQGWKNIPRSE